ncbi:response regulator [Aeoliella sp.]|uniref:response regulator n=1 Tax=Aeoliella sp. TaxID=2795800 RepID=UPI003CCBB8EB
MNKSVFIADDDQDIVDLLTLHCEQAGFKVDSANNAMTALGKIEENSPDVAILDVDMPLGNGLCVREMMVNHQDLQSIPVIMLTASTSEETVRRCHEQMAYYVLKCPDVWSRVQPVLQELFHLKSEPADNMIEHEQNTLRSNGSCEPVDLMDTVFAILGAEDSSAVFDRDGDVPRRSEEPWVLLIEDDDDFALATRLRLQEYGVQVIRAAAGMEGYRRAFMEAPCAIVLDYELPQGNGDYVIRRLKESPATGDIPVIVLTGRREANIERQMRGLGASEFLTKPLDWKRLRTALEANLDLARG